MKKNKKKGESLVESLISLFFITVVLVPVSNIFLKAYKTNIKVDKNSFIESENQNMLELLKTKNYNEIVNFTGKYEISDIDNFYNIFSIENQYRFLNDINKKNRKIEIKQTNNFYKDKFENKKYILELNVEGKREYFFPTF